MASPLALDMSRIPAHVGIIMDGNGRWAKQRKIIRSQGHLEGLKAAKAIVQTASDIGIRFLTLYVFSTENWKRTADEVGFIMGLVKQYLFSELDFFRKNKIRILHTGDINGLPADIAAEIKKVVDDTSDFDGLSVVLALNYGGRDEIVRSVKNIINAGLSSSQVNEECITAHLDNPFIPDPDLIIRSAGEFRTSNFLLWEAAYAEYYISEKLWPDWTKEDLETALIDFQNRDRRFGGVKT